MEAEHMEAEHMEAEHMEAEHMEAEHCGSEHAGPGNSRKDVQARVADLGMTRTRRKKTDARACSGPALSVRPTSLGLTCRGTKAYSSAKREQRRSTRSGSSP